MVNTIAIQRNFREISNYFMLFSITGLGIVVFTMLVQFAIPRPHYVSLGSPSLFQSDRPVYLALNQQGQTFFLWVVNLEGEIRVFDARATHPVAHDRNCIVKWIDEPKPWSNTKNYFTDPCIGGYWWANGEYFGGPAPRNLDWYITDVRNGEIWIDIMYPQEGESWRK